MKKYKTTSVAASNINNANTKSSNSNSSVLSLAVQQATNDFKQIKADDLLSQKSQLLKIISSNNQMTSADNQGNNLLTQNNALQIKSRKHIPLSAELVNVCNSPTAAVTTVIPTMQLSSSPTTLTETKSTYKTNSQQPIKPNYDYRSKVLFGVEWTNLEVLLIVSHIIIAFLYVSLILYIGDNSNYCINQSLQSFESLRAQQQNSTTNSNKKLLKNQNFASASESQIVKKRPQTSNIIKPLNTQPSYFENYAPIISSEQQKSALLLSLDASSSDRHFSVPAMQNEYSTNPKRRRKHEEEDEEHQEVDEEQQHLKSHTTQPPEEHYDDSLSSHTELNDDTNSNFNYNSKQIKQKQQTSSNSKKRNQRHKDEEEHYEDDDANSETTAKQNNNNDKNKNVVFVNRLKTLNNNNNKNIDSNNNTDADSQVCLTAGCVKAAAQVLAFIDESVNPCEDFYQFACGGWIKTHELIPDERSTVSVTSNTKDELDAKLRVLLERNSGRNEQLQQQQQQSSRSSRRFSRRDDTSNGYLKHVRNVYASCMNETRIEERGDEPLLETLQAFGNGWPVLDSRSSQPVDFDWIDWLIKMRTRGFSPDILIDLSVVPDFRNTSVYLVDLDQGYLGLPDRSYYIRGPSNDSAAAAYLKFMIDAATQLGANVDDARKQMTQVFEFETQIARLTMPREERRNVTNLYNRMTIAQLEQLEPRVDWQRFLTGLLDLPNFKLNPTRDFVNVKVPQFVKSIVTLVEETDKRVLANFMLWRVVRQSTNSLGKHWRELMKDYARAVTGRRAEPTRWDYCMGIVTGNLEAALSALYVRNYFDQKSKGAAEQMFKFIREEFLEMLSTVDWMDDETRTEAREKALAMVANVGYPQELLDDNLVGSLYEKLETSPVEFYENMRNLRLLSTNQAFDRLKTRTNKRGDWRKHIRAANVNAYYNIFDNSIELPAGILQGNFFSSDRPMYMNYGGIGYVIGHEITHGFDDRGRQFDLNGNNRNWWRPKTDAAFKKRAKCIIDQYNSFVIPENMLRLNGARSQGENIADNGGVKQAFKAYKRWQRTNSNEEARLPGLQYSQDQLFWISAAQVWCTRNRPEALRLRVMAGAHSPNRFRVLGPLSNLNEFSDSFGCPVNSAMNPSKKCSVW